MHKYNPLHDFSPAEARSRPASGSPASCSLTTPCPITTRSPALDFRIRGADVNPKNPTPEPRKIRPSLGLVFFAILLIPWGNTALADTWRVILKDGTAQIIEADKMTETVDAYLWHKGSTVISKSKSSIDNLQLISQTTPKRDAITPTSSHPTGQALPEEDRPMPRSGSVFTDDDVTSYKRHGQPLYTKKKKADESQRYTDAIDLIKRKQFEEAIYKLYGINQGDSEALFNYANAQVWLRKFGDPDISASYVQKIDSSYKGLFFKEIAEFRKRIHDKNFTKQFVKYQTKLATDEQDAAKLREQKQKDRLRNHSAYLTLGKTISIEAVLLFGFPTDINRTVGKWGAHEQWVYRREYQKTLYLYFENGVLRSWQD